MERFRRDLWPEVFQTSGSAQQVAGRRSKADRHSVCGVKIPEEFGISTGPCQPV